MFNFDVFVVSELKALCAELGIAVGNSAPKSEYIEAVNRYFQDPDVANKLMGLNRDNLQKVARRLSLSASGTKRELTDAIIAKVASADPETEETRKGLSWWEWALIVAAAVVIGWLAFRPRPVATVDLTSIQESIGQVSAKVDALGQNITGLSDRVSALEQAPVAEAEADIPAEVDPEVKAPVNGPGVEVPDVAEANSGDVLDGLNPITKDSGVAVFTTVARSDSFEPAWPEGTNQTAVGYSNPEEYVDGRTFWTRNPVNEDEILAFVAQCVQVNGGDKVCQTENTGAIVGYIVAGPDGEWPVTLWDAELKTLIIPGGQLAWQAYIYELAEFISSNKGGAPVEILGPAQ